MPHIEHKFTAVASIVFATIFLGLSAYSAWSLREDGQSEIHYEQCLRDVDQVVEQPGVMTVTVCGPPQPHFVGDGLAGIFAPTLLALFAGGTFSYGYRGLVSIRELEDDD